MLDERGPPTLDDQIEWLSYHTHFFNKKDRQYHTILATLEAAKTRLVPTPPHPWLLLRLEQSPLHGCWNVILFNPAGGAEKTIELTEAEETDDPRAAVLAAIAKIPVQS